MVLHVLIDLPARQIHNLALLVSLDLLEHLGVALQGILKLLRPVVHDAQVVLAADECGVVLEALFKHLDRHIIKLWI